MIDIMSNYLCWLPKVIIFLLVFFLYGGGGFVVSQKGLLPMRFLDYKLHAQIKL